MLKQNQMHSSYINETPPLDGGICDLVDWIEFKALSNEFLTYKLSDLRSLHEELEDTVDDDISFQDNLDESKLDEVFSEISLRESSLDDAYPFKLDNNTYELIASKPEETTLGGWIYMYCLIVSHAKPDTVLKTSIGLTNSDKRRDHLQVAATYAAGAVLGNAVSFGFPRPEQTEILQAIKTVFTEHIKEGRCLDQPKDGCLTHSKDAGIDVIAWMSFFDNLPGRLIMYGQVASGYNWKEKSIINDVKKFYDTFFSDEPGSHWVPSMFIPFCLDKEGAEQLSNRVNFLTKEFGIIFGRYRLPRLAQIGHEKRHLSNHYIERIDESDCFKEFVNTFKQPQD